MMETKLKNLKRLFVLATVISSTAVVAADFPSKPVTLVVPYSPGGGADTLARSFSASFSNALGKPVIIENKPGASTRVAANYVARSTPDGYTLLLGSTSSMGLNNLLYSNMTYDPQEDYKLLGILAEAPIVMLTNSKVPAKTLQEFVQYAQDKASKGDPVSYSSIGLGTALQLTTELLKEELDFDATHIPYNGSAPALISLMSGQTDLMADLVSSSLPHIKSGKLTPLAVTGTNRAKQLPNVPTVAEIALPEFNAATWFGVAVPSGAAVEVQDTIRAAIDKVLNDPEFQQTVETLALTPMSPLTDEEMDAHISRERVMWKSIIDANNIVLE